MHFHIHKRQVLLVTGVLLLVLIALALIFVRDYKQVSPARVINRDRLSQLVRDHIVLGANDVGEIAPWMTFEYINHVFVLPADYLASALHISDSQYPRLAISAYAKKNNFKEDVFTSEVQNAVKNYFQSPLSH